MPKKVLYFIIFLLIAVIFFISNSNNACDIVFFLPFIKLENVPIVYSLAIAFLVGMLVMLPFSVSKGKKKTGNNAKSAKKSESEIDLEENAP
jgi:uncharacterized integral membrane protein